MLMIYMMQQQQQPVTNSHDDGHSLLLKLSENDPLFHKKKVSKVLIPTFFCIKVSFQLLFAYYNSFYRNYFKLWVLVPMNAYTSKALILLPN